MTETFYDVLGVAEDATTDEIETAYRERLKETHPDVSDDEDASRATKDLIEARDVLVDDEERAKYDRVGHEAYVGDGPIPQSGSATTDSATSAGESDADDDSSATAEAAGSATTDTGAASATGGGTQNRARREQRARQRVSREQRKAGRENRTQSREATGDEATSTANTRSGASSQAGATTAGNASGSDKRKTVSNGHVRGEDYTDSATAAGDGTYSVREDVTSTRRVRRLLPTGRELSLLGIFFALYPVLLFSTLLPIFPLLVNLFLGLCTILTITYLQSMPRVALPLFGGWSVLTLIVLPLFGIGFLNPVGLFALCGTVLPFGFSVLTASALRF